MEAAAAAATALTAIGYGRRRKNDGRHAMPPPPRTCAVQWISHIRTLFLLGRSI